MKNILRFSLIMALVVTSLSCEKENVDKTLEGGKLVKMSFTASTETPTKTYLEGNAVKWHTTDEISLHDGYSAAADNTVNQKFTIETINADGSAVFTGTAATGMEAYYASYPYDASNFVTSEGRMRIAFMSNQIASQSGTFDQRYNSSAAVLKGGVLNFKNLGGLLKFTLTKDHVKKVTLTANDGGTVGGVYYIYFDALGNIDESQTTLASARNTLTLSPSSSNTFAAGTYYFVLSPRTYTGGMTITFDLDGGKTRVASTTQDVVVQRSKITNIGTFDTTPPAPSPVSFPVVFPMGFPTEEPTDVSTGYNYPLNAANTWVQPWSTDEAYGSSQTHWTGHHGTLHCATQPQAYMEWYWDAKIATLNVKHHIETANTIQSGGQYVNISTVGVKGIWTDDYFRFVLPVSNFLAGSTLCLKMPIYTRQGPTFWEVLYKDGSEWKSTAVDNLPAYPGATVTAKATWAIPYLLVTSTTDNEQSVNMTFTNGIEDGTIEIIVKCVDGSIRSSGANAVTTGNTVPNSAAPFYFYNPGRRNDQAIRIELL